MPITKLHFLKTGLQTTIQDGGRTGYQSYGIPISGAMDKQSANLANLIVGNEVDTPVLEITLLGPKIQFEGSCQIAITGANLSPKINHQPVSNYETINVKDGAILSFGATQIGCRSYLAVRGHWQIKKWLDSYSALPNNVEATPESYIQKEKPLQIETAPRIPKKILPLDKQPIYPNSLKIKVLPGPEFEQFSNYTIGYFFSGTHKITNESNRMGYRLDTRLNDFKPQKEVISSGIIPGTIQITRAGQPVILMSDAQTVGGYYRIANVLTEDLNKLAQLKPGEEVAFILMDWNDL